jgi:hypothetical protein
VGCSVIGKKSLHRIGKITSKGCKMTDYQYKDEEDDVVPKTDGKISSWKRVEEYRVNNPSHQFKKKKFVKYRLFSQII